MCIFVQKCTLFHSYMRKWYTLTRFQRLNVWMNDYCQNDCSKCNKFQLILIPNYIFFYFRETWDEVTMSLFHNLKLKRRKVDDSNRSSSDGKFFASNFYLFSWTRIKDKKLSKSSKYLSSLLQTWQSFSEEIINDL